MPRSVAGGSGPKKRRKPPSKTTLAKRQARTYGSQAKQLKTEARRQRQRSASAESRRPPAFRPLPKRNEGFRVERQRQRRQTERARKGLPPHPGIPHVPALKRYTRRQRQLVRDIYHRAAERETGSRSFTRLYDLGNKRQREQMRSVFEGLERSTSKTVAKQRSLRPSLSMPLKAAGRKPPRGPHARMFATIGASELGKRLEVNAQIPGGGSFANALELTKPFQIGGAAAYNIGRATAEDPEAVGKSSLRTAKEMIAGIPAGVKMLVEDPEQALKLMADDYEKRYGSVLEDPAGFREMVKEEYGITPYALDATALAGGGGQALGAAARTSVFGQLSNLPGAAGRAARALHEASKAENARPNLRFSAGEEGVRAQRVSRNLFTALGQRGLDARRGRRHARRVEKAGFIEEPHGRMLRRPGAEVLPDRLPGLRPGPGEVVGRGLRDVGPWRGLTGRIQRDIGQFKSTTRIRMLTHRGRVINEINKTTKGLSDAEKVGVAVMLKYGARSGRASLGALQKRLAEISTREARKARREGGFSDAEMQALQAVVDDPETYLTTNAKWAAGKLKDIQLREVKKDPSLADEQEIVRRFSQQAELLDVDRPSSTLEDVSSRVAEARVAEEALTESIARNEARLATMKPGSRPYENLARDTEALYRRLDDARRQQTVSPKNLRSGEKAPDVGEMERLLNMLEDAAEQQRKAGTYDLGQKGVTHIQKMANDLRQTIERLRAGDDPDVAPTAADVATGRGLPGAIAKAHLPRVTDAEDFVNRVRSAAREANLDEPAYWMSVAEAGTGSRLRAAGAGLKATERNREYTGGLFRIGAEDIGLDVFTQGIERNIKRRFQWQMVARNVETHAYEWSRNNNQGITFSQAANEMRKRAIDPDSVDLIPATIMAKRGADEAGMERGRVLDTVPEGEEFIDAHQAIRGRKNFAQLERDDIASAPMNRYLVVPKEVGEVLEASTKPSGATARTLEIILKQKPTRIMLGALNIPWLGFQVVSNGILTGLGGGLKPWDIYGAHKFFKGLDPEMKEAVEAELGITHGHHFAMDQPHLGDAKQNLPYGVRHLTNFYGAYKRTKVGRGLHKANPLDLMFKADEAQNNFWRRVLFYSQANKKAYNRMGHAWTEIDKAQGSLVENVFKLPPEKQFEAIARHADTFEKHAKHVRDWLGDYTRFSNAERKLLQANVLFYGYLRFSLRFAFYTMPIQHPIMADIIGNIGRMGAQDIKRLFGVPSNYNLPTSMMAQAYFGNRQDARRGTLKSINFGRMNPFLNAVTQMEDFNQSVGLVSPIYQALVDQAFEESSFTGRDWRIEGRPTPGEAERPRNYFGSPLSLLNPGAYSIPGLTEGKPRNRILQNQLLSMAFPYRLGEQIGIPGTGVEPLESSQSDDALLWSPRPMTYKDEEAAAGVRRTRRAERRIPTEERLIQGLGFLPRITAAPQVIEREREKEADQRNRSTGRRKPRKKSRYGGSSSRYGSSSSRYGG